VTLPTADPVAAPTEAGGRPPRIVVSCTRPAAEAEGVRAGIGGVLLPMGSAGTKTAAVVSGKADRHPLRPARVGPGRPATVAGAAGPPDHSVRLSVAGGVGIAREIETTRLRSRSPFRSTSPDKLNVLLGQAHFIKAVEDIHDVLAGVSSHLRFGIACFVASEPMRRPEPVPGCGCRSGTSGRTVDPGAGTAHRQGAGSSRP
jgi:hypothetical protein